ncbi:MXAN_6652 family MXYO-CTERM-anchored protein [Archangium violaceum]|uniref:MXAN_6652 family MXYO-CTERM-anchored protein n=1 Tax=Archangium violaceum TaxID=83451 RepID=UPI0005BD6945|nr:MXAN_6652 family MXYO-CTERM-anchored protein [Archangium violaceum]
MRFVTHSAGMAVVCLLSTPALATSTGITGQSGKDGLTCNSCHSGGTAPTVEFTGPTTLAPGATGQFSFIIRGGPAKTGGVDLAVNQSDAVLQPGPGTKKLGAELAHSEPKAFTGNELRFDFSLVAPARDVTLTIFGAGNSADGDRDSSGDRAASTRLQVVVGNGTPDPTTPDDEPEEEPRGGCSTTGSSSVWALALAGAFWLPRRRRS